MFAGLHFKHVSMRKLYPSKLQIYRCFSQKSFLENILDKIRSESEKDKEIKESIKKFRQETEKLEKSKEVQSIRELYKKIEKEIPVNKFKDKIDELTNKIQNETESLAKNKAMKESIERLKQFSSTVSDASKNISQSQTFKSAVDGVKIIENEFITDRAKIYVAPQKIKKRAELSSNFKQRVVEANEEDMGMVLHKDSRWFNAWQDFKDNNSVAKKYFDLRTKYEESENPILSSMRIVSEKFSGIFNSFSSKNELQTVLDEIVKMDPNFTLESFMRFCRFDIIPNVLEAIVKGNLEVLQDWCHEAPYNVISNPIKQAYELNLKFDSHVVDINNVELQMGKMMDQGPVLIVSFQTQQISCLRDSKGEVKEGDPEKLLRFNHVWALCRDQSDLYPWTSWRVLDIGMMASDQWL